MTCKLPTDSQFVKAGVTSLVQRLANLAAMDWAETANGSTKRFTILIGEEGAATVQMERVQNLFGVVRRVLARVPIGDTGQVLVALYRAGSGWTHTIRDAGEAPTLFENEPRGVAIPSLPISQDLAALRKLVVCGYPSEGQFLDWLAYKSEHGIVVDTVHDLSRAQIKRIVRAFEVTA